MWTPEEAGNSQGGATSGDIGVRIVLLERFHRALKRPGPPNPDELFERDTEGNTPLHLAVQLGDRDIMKLFFNRVSQHHSNLQPSSRSDGPGDDGEIEEALWKRCLTEVNGNGDVALHIALKKEHDDFALLMIESHPHMSSIVNKASESPLYLAVERFCDKVVNKILFSSSDDSDDAAEHIISGPSRKTPLHAAVICRNWAALDLILDHKLITTPDGQANYYEKLRNLMINRSDEHRKTPLHYAVEDEQDDTVKLLMEASPLSACLYDNEGYTPLLRAAEKASVKIIKIILKHCPYSLEFHHKKDGRTALHLAQMDAESLIVCLTGTSMNDLVYERDDKGYTPLHLATIEQDYEKVFALTFHGDCNWRVRNSEYKDDEDSMVRPIDYLSKKASKKFSSWEQLLASSYLDMTAQRWKPRMVSHRRIMNILNNIRPIIPWGQNKMVKNFIEHNMEKDEVNHKLNNIFIVGGLILTITFAAAFTIPGGINQETGQALLINNPHTLSTDSTNSEEADSRLRKLSGPLLGFFLASDSAAMIYSAIILMWYAWSFTSTTNKEKVRLLFQLGFFLFGSSLLTIFAFASGFMAVTGVQRKEANWLFLLIAGFSASLLHGISGTLVVNYFPVTGEVLKLAVNYRVIWTYAKQTWKKASERFIAKLK